MLTPHISIYFKFNDESILWLDKHIPRLIETFDQTFPEQGGPIFNGTNEVAAKEFQSSPPAVDVRNFLNRLGFTNLHIQMFMYKVQDKAASKENVHFDTPGFKPLPGRFNILIVGNTDSKMHWWDINLDDAVVEASDTPIGKRWQIPGNGAREQVALIGEPDYSASDLSVFQQTGDFVRTDIAHSIERDGQRRVIVSVQIHHPWTEIVEKAQWWRGQGFL
jgi:hypothetical protein